MTKDQPGPQPYTQAKSERSSDAYTESKQSGLPNSLKRGRPAVFAKYRHLFAAGGLAIILLVTMIVVHGVISYYEATERAHCRDWFSESTRTRCVETLEVRYSTGWLAFWAVALAVFAILVGITVAVHRDRRHQAFVASRFDQLRDLELEQTRLRSDATRHDASQQSAEQSMAEDVDSEGTDPFPAEADLDLLALDELWVSNTRRITIYHELVTSYARSTRLTTLLTIGTGFALIVIVGVVGAVTTDGLPARSRRRQSLSRVLP